MPSVRAVRDALKSPFRMASSEVSEAVRPDSDSDETFRKRKEEGPIMAIVELGIHTAADAAP